MTNVVDVVVLTRDSDPLDERVESALRSQCGITTRAFQVVGPRRDDDRARWDAIVRARNHAISVGASPWIMFLDDDVVLSPDAVSRLQRELAGLPRQAAVGVNYLNEPRTTRPAPHVAMGATLFRREALQQIRFRWQPGQCECRCCCEDLRRLGWEIDYLDDVHAKHLRPYSERARVPSQIPRGRILVAFNRRHIQKFRTHFLRTLRAWGNQETVYAAVYGLYPSELRMLRRLPGVEVVPLPVNGIMPPIRRLTDFQHLIADWPDHQPVAYWDAGDVIFQSRLESLWHLTQVHAHKLLAVREPRGYPHNPAVAAWTLSIQDPAARREAFSLFTRNPFLNSGFAAGTAKAMRRYLWHAVQYRNSATLIGTSDWGDQTALNLYCHREPHVWHEVPMGWNFCLHDRVPGEVGVAQSGMIYSRFGTQIHVAHGNACSLRKLELTRDEASVPRRAIRSETRLTPDAATRPGATLNRQTGMTFKVVMFSTSNIQRYASLSAEINRRYCELHGYEFVHETYDSVALTPSHEKVRLLRKHLGTAPYLLWLDSDACVIDYSQQLRNFAPPGSDFIIAGHEFGFDLTGRRVRYQIKGIPCGVNAGVMLIRNSEWSRHFLELWWERCVEGHQAQTAFYEQGHLQQMLIDNALNMQAHTSIVTPCSRLNRCDDDNTDVCEFVLHLWGSNAEHREHVFKEILQGRQPDIGVSMPTFNVRPKTRTPAGMP